MRLAINMKPISGPWGGGNQFVRQLTDYLRDHGHSVSFRLWPWTDRILLVAPRPFQHVTFDIEDIRRFKAKHPSARCIHRINQTDMARGADWIDNLFCRANEVADMTVFISDWIRDYSIARWFAPTRPHAVIHNGADPNIYYPASTPWDPQRQVCSLVTHHWSDNAKKGFAVYQQVDQIIAEGQLPGFALTVIGRWPKEAVWRAATHLPPLRASELGKELRRHHIYLTAAIAESGGMHHIEGALCGLPLVYHEDGGGIVEMGRQYGVGFRSDVKSALLEARDRYGELREKAIRLAPSGLDMCRRYEELLAG